MLFYVRLRIPHSTACKNWVVGSAQPRNEAQRSAQDASQWVKQRVPIALHYRSTVALLFNFSWSPPPGNDLVAREIGE
jgi:hypothetical protein